MRALRPPHAPHISFNPLGACTPMPPPRALRRKRLILATAIGFCFLFAAWLFTADTSPVALGNGSGGDLVHYGYNSVVMLGLPAFAASIALGGNVHGPFTFVFYVVFFLEGMAVGYLASFVFFRRSNRR
jgi:hypothetical protein